MAMLFNFRLRPVDQVSPWNSDQGKPNLHWFGLTDGWYWLDVGGEEVFRYSDAVLTKRRLASEIPLPYFDLPYVDYYVVRIWEDLFSIYSSILESVPDDLAKRLHPGTTWEDWCRRAYQWSRQKDTEEAEGLFCLAVDWWDARWLDAGYLKYPPRIHFWTEGDRLSLCWDNRDLQEDGLPVWSSVAGEVMMPVSDFLGEFQSFHIRFMDAMQERVAAVRDNWTRPEVSIDLAQLAKEQQDRSTWLARTLGQDEHKKRRKWYTNWNRVREAIARIEADPQFRDIA